VALADSLISIVLDSDDILVPNALETVWGYYDTNANTFRGNCVCVSGLDIEKNGKMHGDKFPKDEMISDSIRMTNMDLRGDKCEFYLTRVLKQFPYPIFEGEKFIPESLVWNRIALRYNTLYINKPLEMHEQFPDGLAAHAAQLWRENPAGCELYYNEATSSKFSLPLQIKHSYEYITYAKMNRRRFIFCHAQNKVVFVAGYMLFLLKHFSHGLRNWLLRPIMKEQKILERKIDILLDKLSRQDTK